MTTSRTDTDFKPSGLTVLTDEEKLFRETVREFAENEIGPLVSKMDRDMAIDPGLAKKFFELGLMGIEIPDAYGGAGSSFFMAALAVEAVSRVDASLGVFIDVQNTLVEFPLLRYGTAEQQRKYLRMLTSGTVGAYALSEAGSGSDAFGLATRATQKDGRWVLNGRKRFITNAGQAMKGHGGSRVITVRTGVEMAQSGDNWVIAEIADGPRRSSASPTPPRPPDPPPPTPGASPRFHGRARRRCAP